MKTTNFSRPSCVVGQCYLPENEAERIRAVFGLYGERPLPPVNGQTLRTYHQYLAAHLSFPFPALVAESEPPIRNLVRYIEVLGLQEVAGRASQGIVCNVEGAVATHKLPLVEIGVRDDHPNYRLIDDYVYWFSHFARMADWWMPLAPGFRREDMDSFLAANWQLHLESVKCAAESGAYRAFPELAERATREAEQLGRLPPPKNPAEMGQLIAQSSILQGSWNSEFLSRTALRTTAEMLSGTQKVIDTLLQPAS